MRAALSCEPLAVSFVLSLILSLALRLLPQRTRPTPDFAPGVEVSIRSGTSGKYVEVGDNLWLYASYYSHNKPSCRFEVQGVDASLVRSLTGTREYRESAGARSGWDVRGADKSEGAAGVPKVTDKNMIGFADVWLSRLVERSAAATPGLGEAVI